MSWQGVFLDPFLLICMVVVFTVLAIYIEWRRGRK